MKNLAKCTMPFHFSTDDPDLTRLLKPATAYRSPADVVEDGDLSLAEKRAILASWASDSCAVRSKPALRHPKGLSEPVSFDAIMSALQDLDRTHRGEARTQSAQGSEETPIPIC
jgi:hypothetical protein